MRTSTPGPLCAHGYPADIAAAECVRCAEHAPAVRVVEHPQAPTTRWHGTDTTLGPVVKVTLTTLLVVPPLILLYALRFAHSYLGNVFFIAPIGVFLVVDTVFLPQLWAPGRLRRVPISPRPSIHTGAMPSRMRDDQPATERFRLRTGRMEAFSDGIVAIAITLLVRRIRERRHRHRAPSGGS